MSLIELCLVLTKADGCRWVVTAINGQFESPTSSPAASPEFTGGNGATACRAPPGWCSSGAGGSPPATAPIDGSDPPSTGGSGQQEWQLNAPDYSGDSIAPFPSLTNPDGSDLTIENIRGVHLFGFKGCTGDQGREIKQTYNEFFELSNNPALYNNIDWNSRAATDFWGPGDGDAYVIPAGTRAEIQRKSLALLLGNLSPHSDPSIRDFRRGTASI